MKSTAYSFSRKKHKGDEAQDEPALHGSEILDSGLSTTETILRTAANRVQASREEKKKSIVEVQNSFPTPIEPG